MKEASREQENALTPAEEISNQLAIVLYTSGSTGVPKGIGFSFWPLITHLSSVWPFVQYDATRHERSHSIRQKKKKRGKIALTCVFRHYKFQRKKSSLLAVLWFYALSILSLSLSLSSCLIYLHHFILIKNCIEQFPDSDRLTLHVQSRNRFYLPWNLNCLCMYVGCN